MDGFLKIVWIVTITTSKYVSNYPMHEYKPEVSQKLDYLVQEIAKTIWCLKSILREVDIDSLDAGGCWSSLDSYADTTPMKISGGFGKYWRDTK